MKHNLRPGDWIRPILQMETAELVTSIGLQGCCAGRTGMIGYHFLARNGEYSRDQGQTWRLCSELFPKEFLDTIPDEGFEPSKCVTRYELDSIIQNLL